MAGKKTQHSKVGGSLLKMDQLKTFMDAVNHPVGIFDADFNLVDMNSYAEKLMGERKDSIGRNITYYSPRIAETGRLDIYKNVMRTGRPAFIEEIDPHPNLYDRKVAIQAVRVGDCLALMLQDMAEVNKARKEDIRLLEEIHAAVADMKKKSDRTRKRVESRIEVNIRKQILPYVYELKKTGLTPRQEKYVNLIEKRLAKVISPFVQNLSSFNLTNSELKVATLIRDGSATKDIATFFGISTHTVNYHRKNIRKKIGLDGKKPTLYAFFRNMG